MTTISSLEKQVEIRRQDVLNTVFLREDPKECEVKAFPETWSTFNGTMNLVRGVEIPGISKSVVCVYYSIEGGKFPKHIHSSKEHIIVLKGSVNIEYPQGSTTIETGSYYEIGDGIAHSVHMEADSVVIIAWTGVESVGSANVDIRPVNCKNKNLEDITKEYETVIAMEQHGMDVSTRLSHLKQMIEDAQGAICSIVSCKENCAYELTHGL